MYIPRNWEFGSAFQNFGISGEGGVETPLPAPSVRRSLLSSLNVNDQVSHPIQNRQHSISVHLINKFLNRKLDDKRFSTE
jgi:hypothetical protein